MAAAIALIGAGSVVSAMGQIQAARQQRLQAEFSAGLKKEQAAEMLKRTAYNMREMVREQRALTGAQEAAFAKGGVELTGSAMNVIEDTVFRYEERMRGMKQQTHWEANRLRRIADAEIASGKAMEKIGYYGALGTVLTGGGNAMAAGYRMGVFSPTNTSTTPGYGGSHGTLYSNNMRVG